MWGKGLGISFHGICCSCSWEFKINSNIFSFLVCNSAFKILCACPTQVSTGMCGWCMSSQAPCPAASLTSPTAAETTAANSRSRASGRNTAWEHQWQELATRLSGMTMSLNCTSSCLENRKKQKGLNRITPAALIKTIIFPLLPTHAVTKINNSLA